MNNSIFLIDIDGCILPNLFTNYGWAKKQDQDIVIKEVNEKGKDVRLFPNFIEYYRVICKDAQKIYFITGRQEAPFRNLTLINLKALWDLQYDFTIIWYPPDRKHTSKKYFKWKTNTIKTLIKGYTKTSAKYGLKNSFYIYDDLSKYFPKIIKYTNRHKIKCLCLKKDCNEDWIL